MHVLWLGEDYVKSCHNHPTQGDYNIEALIFKMAAAWFLDLCEEETSKMNSKKMQLLW